MNFLEKIKTVNLIDIKPYKNNSKIHDQKQIDLLIKSIKNNGYYSPIYIDKDYNIVIGHGRYQALKKINQNQKIQVIMLDHLSEDRINKLRIQDNKIVSNKYNNSLLKAEIESLYNEIETEKIYLWGMQVFGENPSEFMAATANLGIDGDQEGWIEFLDLSNNIFEKYGDIPFIHWHHYEKQFIKKYLDRYGDIDNIATRVMNNLVDLLPITQNSIALPLPSYSLKVIEKYIGYERIVACFPEL